MEIRDISADSHAKIKIISRALLYTGIATATVLADFIVLERWHEGRYKDDIEKLVDRLYLLVQDCVMVEEMWANLGDYASLNKN
jgi:hypothetical protein